MGSGVVEPVPSDVPTLAVYEEHGRLLADCPGDCGQNGKVTPRGPDGMVQFDCFARCAASGIYRRADAAGRGSVTNLRPGRKSRTLLPSQPPDAGATHEELAGWLTAALGLGADPVAKVERYGRHEDSRLVILLSATATRITFDRAGDVFDPARLVRRVVLATGATLPSYGKADAQAIATAIVRVAETLADDDDRGEAREWGRTFLSAAAPNEVTVSTFATPAGRWEALCALARHKPPIDLPPYAPAAERSALILDGHSGDRMVRTSDVGAHVRGIAGRPISWASLHGRMSEVGWTHIGELHQRQPSGDGRAKAHVYIVPADWEVS